MHRRPQKASEGHKTGGHGQKSPTVREAAIVALLSSRRVPDAATAAGVSERTLRRWLASDEQFQLASAEARRAVFDRAVARLQGLTERAVDALEALLDMTAPAAVRLGSARLILEIGFHERDAETILRRIEQIERAQEERNDRGL